jgi:hypothetical protein
MMGTIQEQSVRVASAPPPVEIVEQSVRVASAPPPVEIVEQSVRIAANDGTAIPASGGLYWFGPDGEPHRLDNP